MRYKQCMFLVGAVLVGLSSSATAAMMRSVWTGTFVEGPSAGENVEFRLTYDVTLEGVERTTEAGLYDTARGGGSFGGVSPVTSIQIKTSESAWNFSPTNSILYASAENGGYAAIAGRENTEYGIWANLDFCDYSGEASCSIVLPDLEKSITYHPTRTRAGTFSAPGTGGTVEFDRVAVAPVPLPASIIPALIGFVALMLMGRARSRRAKLD